MGVGLQEGRGVGCFFLSVSLFDFVVCLVRCPLRYNLPERLLQLEAFSSRPGGLDGPGCFT